MQKRGATSMAKHTDLTLGLLVGFFVGIAVPSGFFKPWYETNTIYVGDLVTRNGGFGQKVDCLNGKVLYAGPHANEMYNNVLYTGQGLLVDWQNCLESNKYHRGGYTEYTGSEYVSKYKEIK